MEINNIKSIWQNASTNSKSELELKRMTNVINHPSLKKIRTKFLIETISLTFFLFIYYDWFEGNTKPFYLNSLLATILLAYILNDVFGYFLISRPIRGENLKISIEKYYVRIKRLSVYSLSISFLYGTVMIYYFSSGLIFNNKKLFILAGIVIFLLLMTYFSYRTWNRWIKSLKIQVNEFISDGIN